MRDAHFVSPSFCQKLFDRTPEAAFPKGITNFSQIVRGEFRRGWGQSLILENAPAF